MTRDEAHSADQRSLREYLGGLEIALPTRATARRILIVDAGGGVAAVCTPRKSWCEVCDEYVTRLWAGEGMEAVCTHLSEVHGYRVLV